MPDGPRGCCPMNDFSAVFVSRHLRFADYVDADEANSQAELLRKIGLDALNRKVLASPSEGVLDVIAEHNMAAMLVRRDFTDLQHEPSSMSRPVDLVGVHRGRYYRVEVKRLAASERDDLHSTVMQTLNKALESNTESIVIQMQLSESFEAADINALVRHVKQALREQRMEEALVFAPDEETAVSYKFRRSANARNPYVGILGYMGVAHDVTGVDASRVLSKVKRAYDKFKACPDDGGVRLVALEVDNTIELVDVAEALYGREYATFTSHGYSGTGGAFSRGLHSRLGGLVVARRAERYRLFCSYTFTLFENPGGALPVADVVQALGVELALGPRDFP
jgi:hypothetical protein